MHPKQKPSPGSYYNPPSTLPPHPHPVRQWNFFFHFPDREFFLKSIPPAERKEGGKNYETVLKWTKIKFGKVLVTCFHKFYQLTTLQILPAVLLYHNLDPNMLKSYQGSLT